MPRRFSQHLEGLKDEFDAMVQEIESLKKERDEYKAKVQAMELDDIRPEKQVWTVKFNDEVEKELDVQKVHSLSHGKRIWSVRFSQDGKRLATGCVDGKTYIYDVRTGNLTSTLGDLLAKDPKIWTICFSFDGKYLAIASSDTYIHIWEINAKFVRKAFKGHSGVICLVHFSPNGRLVASASDDHTIRLWNVRDGSGKILTGQNLGYLPYTSVVFSPDGKHLAGSDDGGMVGIWHVRTCQLIWRVNGHSDRVCDVAFMPDGKGLVSAGDQTMKYWDISSLHNIQFPQSTNGLHGDVLEVEEQTLPERAFSGHEEAVYALAISPDGRWVASGSFDKSVRIWNSRTAVWQCSLNNDTEILSVVFSPAGRFLASGGNDGMAEIWRYSN